MVGGERQVLNLLWCVLVTRRGWFELQHAIEVVNTTDYQPSLFRDLIRWSLLSEFDSRSHKIELFRIRVCWSDCLLVDRESSLSMTRITYFPNFLCLQFLILGDLLQQGNHTESRAWSVVCRQVYPIFPKKFFPGYKKRTQQRNISTQFLTILWTLVCGLWLRAEPCFLVSEHSHKAC